MKMKTATNGPARGYLPTPRTASASSAMQQQVTVTRRLPSSSSGKVLLAERGRVDCEGRGLVGINGATAVINEIRDRRSITKLSLSFNSLGNAGAVELMEFLCTTEGVAHKIAELRLIANSIGDEGLAAIVRYLNGNVYLKDLYIQDNEFGGSEKLGSALGIAINSSRLSMLNLNTNRHMTAPFFKALISSLDSSTLRELHISNLGLKAEVTPEIIDYLSCLRSRALRDLGCNANELGEKAIGDIIRAIKSKNFNLQKVDLYASRFTGSGHEEQDRQNWEAELRMLEKAKTRNGLLHSKVVREALDLLRYSRTILLPALRYCQSRPMQDAPESIDSKLDRPSDESAALFVMLKTSTSRQSLHICALPTEIQYQILCFLSPTLSNAQCVRIFNYAAQFSTLPSVLPPLWHSRSPHLPESTPACLPDPANLPFGTEGNSLGFGLGSGAAKGGVVCSSGRCMGSSGSVLCQRTVSRLRWLEKVGCTHFDAQDLSEEDVWHLLGATDSHV